jgi:hypothetical protein
VHPEFLTGVREDRQAYIFDMDDSKSPLLLHLRSEVHHGRAMAARLREFASGTDAGKQELIRAAEAEERCVEECEKAIATLSEEWEKKP